MFNIEDFEVVNSSNKHTLDAILYIEKNLNSDLLRKLKKSGILGIDSQKTDLVPLVVDLFKNNQTTKELFRQSTKSNEILTNLWVSNIRKKAEEKVLLKKDFKKFQALTRNDLKEIAAYSNIQDKYLELENILLDYGIILIYCKNIEGMKTDAVTFKLNNGTPVIGMSLRFARYDHFWFTLMHELSHICLHIDLLDSPIIDSLYDSEDNPIENIEEDEIEDQANMLARLSLIPRNIWAKCKARFTVSDKLLVDFSTKYNIDVSIVAGFIRYEQQKYFLYKEFQKDILRDKLLGN